MKQYSGCRPGLDSLETSGNRQRHRALLSLLTVSHFCGRREHRGTNGATEAYFFSSLRVFALRNCSGATEALKPCLGSGVCTEIEAGCVVREKMCALGERAGRTGSQTGERELPPSQHLHNATSRIYGTQRICYCCWSTAGSFNTGL